MRVVARLGPFSVPRRAKPLESRADGPDSARRAAAGLFEAFKGDLFCSTLAGQALLRIRFTAAAQPERATAIERWFNTGPRGSSLYGRLRALAVGPDGAIYVGTSNRDGRGSPAAGDDRVLRLVPR